MDLFLVAVLLHPTKKQKDEEGTLPLIVVPATAVVAKDAASAGAKGLRMVPEEHDGKDDRLDVRVLPFRTVQ